MLSNQTKIDGALGTMIIEDQPTHSIYSSSLAKIGQKVNSFPIGLRIDNE